MARCRRPAAGCHSLLNEPHAGTITSLIWRYRPDAPRRTLVLIAIEPRYYLNSRWEKGFPTRWSSGSRQPHVPCLSERTRTAFQCSFRSAPLQCELVARGESIIFGGTCREEQILWSPNQPRPDGYRMLREKRWCARTDSNCRPSGS